MSLRYQNFVALLVQRYHQRVEKGLQVFLVRMLRFKQGGQFGHPLFKLRDAPLAGAHGITPQRSAP